MAVRVVVCGARFERAVTTEGAAELERQLFMMPTQDHLLKRLLHLLVPQPHDNQADTPVGLKLMIPMAFSALPSSRQILDSKTTMILSLDCLDSLGDTLAKTHNLDSHYLCN